MGRRKLPSLPGQQSAYGTSAAYQPTFSFSASATSSAPVYYTSSAPEKKDVGCNGSVIPNGTVSRGVLGGSSYASAVQPHREPKPSVASLQYIHTLPKPSLPTSTTAAQMHPVDPAILPGATYKLPEKPRQMMTLSGPTVGRPQAQPPKVSDTMSQLMFRKELREVLAERRKHFDTTEIEADHRQYVINRMLSSGLMPDHRPPELDDIPRVVKCGLPAELVEGARVVPAKRPIVQRARPEVSTSYALSPRSLKKSVACQCEQGARVSSTYYQQPTTSLSQQLRAEAVYGSGVSRTKTVETQTELAPQEVRAPRRAARTSAVQTSFAAQNGPDLLASTQRYFDEYDKRLREAAAKLDKRRFRFSNTDSLSDSEARQREVMQELEKRREQISSMLDLSTQQNPLDFPAGWPPSSDYASTVPHYGSLPRMGGLTRMSRAQAVGRADDLYSRNRYSSLPRNYERLLGETTIDSDGRPISFGVQSHGWRSMGELGQDADYGEPMMTGFGYPRSLSGVELPQAAMDDYYLAQSSRRCPRGAATAGADTGMVSQYASYLNNQFRLQQDDVTSAVGPLPDYRTALAPPRAPAYMDEEFAFSQPPAVNVIASQPVSRAVPQYPAAYSSSLNGYVDRFDFAQPPPAMGHVYSRSERNYGARPALAGDYGNFLHNRAQSLHQLESLQDFVNHNVGYTPPAQYSQYRRPYWSSLSGTDQLADPVQSMWNRPAYASRSMEPLPVGSAYGYGRNQLNTNAGFAAQYSPYAVNNNAYRPYADDLNRVMQNYGRQSGIRPSSYGAYNPGMYNLGLASNRFLYPDGR